MEISERQRQINRDKTKGIVTKAQTKIAKQESIKVELFLLKQIYDYLRDMHEEESKTIKILEEIIPEFNAYQRQFDEDKKQARNQLLKLQKMDEYKKMWGEKSTFYKIFHRKLNPHKIDISATNYDTIKEKAETLISKKK